jgi:hypothetical protein
LTWNIVILIGVNWLQEVIDVIGNECNSLLQVFLSILHEKHNSDQLFMSFAPYFAQKKCCGFAFNYSISFGSTICCVHASSVHLYVKL